MGREMRGGVKGDQERREEADAACVELHRREGLAGGGGGHFNRKLEYLSCWGVVSVILYVLVKLVEQLYVQGRRVRLGVGGAVVKDVGLESCSKECEEEEKEEEKEEKE